jgi:hypothetical protein
MKNISQSSLVNGKLKPRGKTLSPGPGEYTITRTEPTRFYLSTASRNDLRSSLDLPGPGSYSPSMSESSPRISYFICSFAKSLRESQTLKDSTPGPGQYPSKLGTSPGPMYSMKGKTHKSKIPTVPGPGAYDPSLDYSCEKFPSYRIGTSKRETNINRFNGPGPASYSMDLTSLSGPKWKIGNSMRKMFRQTETPGPDVYNVPGPSPGISYSISPSKLITKPSCTPGPGSYSPSHSQNSPRVFIGTGKRETKFNSSTPGPGSYDPESKASTQRAMCKF